MSVYREIRLFGKTVIEMSGFSGTVVAQESSTIHHGLQKKIESMMFLLLISWRYWTFFCVYMDHVFVAAKPGSQIFHDIL